MSSNSFMRKKFTLIFFTIQHIFRRTSQNLVSHVVVTTVDKEVAESSFTAYCIQQILVKKKCFNHSFLLDFLECKIFTS